MPFEPALRPSWVDASAGARVIIHLPSLSVSERQRRTIPNLDVPQHMWKEGAPLASARPAMGRHVFGVLQRSR